MKPTKLIDHGHPWSIRRHFRHYAVYDGDGKLIALTVYKKGAIEVRRRLCPS